MIIIEYIFTDCMTSSQTAKEISQCNVALEGQYPSPVWFEYYYEKLSEIIPLSNARRMLQLLISMA